MSITNDLIELNGDKSDIQDALVAKGVTSAGKHGFNKFASDITSITNQYSSSDEGKVVSSGSLVSQTSTTATTNGTIDTTTNNEVVVNVPNSYTQADEGKVVQSGSLVAQTSTTVSQNGTVNTTTNNQVVVSVPNTYTAQDEGKVVSNGALVAQTAMSTEITANDTYDTTLYNSVTVNVPQGGGGNVVKVTTLANATVTLSNQSDTYTVTANNNGLATFNDVIAGNYTITAEYDDATSETSSITVVENTATAGSFATLTLVAIENTTITVTDGTITKTLSYTGTPIVQYVSLGAWTVSASISGETVTTIINVSEYINYHYILGQPYVTREVDFLNNTTNVTGDINQLYVYQHMGRCNVADDGTINAYYGDAGYTEDGSNGQVMVIIPKFYYNIDVSQTGDLDGAKIRKGRWSISDVKLSNSYKLHPAFIAPDGVTELPYFLYGAFEAVGQDDNGVYDSSYNTTSYKLGSVGGNQFVPTTNTLVNVARTMAESRGTGWYLTAVWQTMAIQMLFAVEYGFNSQLLLGNGIYNSSLKNTGTTIGNTSSGSLIDTDTAVNYRGIENLWGNLGTFVDGVNISIGTPYICDTYNFVNDTTSGYSPVNFTLPYYGNYISAFGYDANYDWVFFGLEQNGTVDGAIGDYNETYGDIRVVSLGGNYASSDNKIGLFYLNMKSLSEYTSGYGLGSRIMYLPITT